MDSGERSKNIIVRKLNSVRQRSILSYEQTKVIKLQVEGYVTTIDKDGKGSLN